MKGVRCILVVVACACTLVAGCRDTPELPEEGIPSDISPRLRDAVHLLYVADLGQPRERVYALNRLWEMGAEAAPATRLLIPWLGEQTGVTVEEFQRAKTSVRLGTATEVRLEESRKWESTVGRVIADMLGQMGEPAVEPLIEALNHEGPGVRGNAARGLAETGDPRAVEPLLDAIRDSEAYVRAMVALALGETKDPRAIAPLIDALGDEDADVRWAAAVSVDATHHPQAVSALIKGLRDEDESVRRGCVIGLTGISDARLAEALKKATVDEDEGVRKAVLDVSEMASITEARVINALIAALADENVRVRAAAVDALGLEFDPRVEKPLIDALQDPEAYVRRKAARALGPRGATRRAWVAERGGDETAAIAALAAALKDRYAFVRAAAAGALVSIGDPRVVDPLIGALEDEYRTVQWAAAHGLAQLDDPRGTGALTAALEHRLYSVRACAALALGDVSDPQIIDGLITFLTDEHGFEGEVARVTNKALIEMRPVDSLLSLLTHRNSKIRSRAVFLLGEIGETSAVEPMVELLAREGEPAARVAIIRALAKLRDPRAVDLLARIVIRHGDSGPRSAAARALGEIGDRRAVDSLIVTIPVHDVGIQLAIAEALGMLGDRRAVGPLMDALATADDLPKFECAKSLRKLTGQDFGSYELEKWRQWWAQHKTEYE